VILTRASLVAWMVKNLPAMQETWFQSLGQEDPLEQRMVTHSSIFAWRIPWAEEHGRLYSPWGHKELDVTNQLIHTHVSSNRGKMVLPLFSTYSTYHLGAGALVGEFGSFLSHRFLDPTPGLGCDTRELLILKIFSKGFDVQPT